MWCITDRQPGNCRMDPLHPHIPQVSEIYANTVALLLTSQQWCGAVDVHVQVPSWQLSDKEFSFKSKLPSVVAPYLHLFFLCKNMSLYVFTENLPKRESAWRRGRSSWSFGGSSRSRESSPDTWSGSAKQVRLISETVWELACVCCVRKTSPLSLPLQRRCCWRRRMRLQRRSPRWTAHGTRGNKTFQVRTGLSIFTCFTMVHHHRRTRVNQALRGTIHHFHPVMQRAVYKSLQNHQSWMWCVFLPEEWSDAYYYDYCPEWCRCSLTAQSACTHCI